MLPAECPNRTDREIRQQKAERPSDQRHDQTFHEHLGDQPTPGRAERGADRDFPGSNEPAHQEQVGDVGARDQHHDTDGGEQNQQRRTHFTDHRFLKAPDFGRLLRAGVRVLKRQPLGDCPQFGVCLLDGGASFHPCHDSEVVTAAAGICRVHGDRDPVFRLPRGKAETRRHHAHDRERRAAQGDRASQRRVGAEAALPHAVAEDDHIGFAGRVLLCLKPRPSAGATQQLERVPGDRGVDDSIGPFASTKVALPPV